MTEFDLMGFSSSTTQLLFFLAATMVAVGLVGAFNQQVKEYSDQMHTRNEGMYDSLNADIQIINDPYNVPNDPLTFYVKNTGRCQLYTNLTHILIDGQYLETSQYTMEVLGGESEWNMTTVLKIVVTSPEEYSNLGAGDHTVKVVANDNAATARMVFRID